MTHGPVTPEMYERMNALAKSLDLMFNGDGPRKVGFALLTYNLNDDTGRINYIGNGRREDVLVALKELVAQWEGRHIEPEGLSS
jgi:hypothetical protein